METVKGVVIEVVMDALIGGVRGGKWKRDDVEEGSRR